MDVSRRAFVKTGFAGVIGLSAFGFDAEPLYAQSQGLKISRTHGNPQHLRTVP